jgi:benzoylformate decarboxylase
MALSQTAPLSGTESATGQLRLLEQLRSDGVKYLFGNPGSTEEGLLDQIAQWPDLEYVLGLQEAAVIGIADGYAQAAGNGRPSVALLHAGVGLGNAIGGLYHAMRRHTPMVVLVGEAGVAFDALEAHMAADLVAMARPVTKYATRAGHPDSVLRLFRRCFKVAATPPRGPVMLALPQDVLDQPNREPVLPTVLPETRVRPAPETMDRAVGLLADAQSPIIIVGDGVAASGAAGELTRCAEIWGAPVWGAMASELLMPWNHPLYGGLLGHMFGEVSASLVAEADAVLVCGSYLFPEVFPLTSSPFQPDATIVHIDLDAAAIAKNHPVALGLVADPRLTLQDLAAGLERSFTPQQRARATERTMRLTRQVAADRERLLRDDESHFGEVPLRMSTVAHELRRLLPEDAVVFDESLTCSPELTRWLPPQRPGRFFQTPGGTLGVGLPGAIGAAFAQPDRTVIGLTGDGGLMYTLPALWTAAHYGVAAKMIVCHNGGYQLLKENLAAYRRMVEPGAPARDFPGFFDVSSPRVDAVGLAQALGVPARRVTDPAEIAPALRDLLTHPGPFLVEAVLSGEVT